MGIETGLRTISRDGWLLLQNKPKLTAWFFPGYWLGHDDDPDESNVSHLEKDAVRGVRFSLDKDWHVLHFLLTGDANLEPGHAAPPLGNAIHGGHDTQFEATYGCVRGNRPLLLRWPGCVLCGRLWRATTGTYRKRVAAPDRVRPNQGAAPGVARLADLTNRCGEAEAPG